MNETTFGTIDHAGAESDVVDRKARRIADTFRRDDQMERLLELRENDPDRYAKLPHRNRLAVGYYSVARAAAQEAALEDEDAA